MPIQHNRPSRTGTIPYRDLKQKTDPNWMKGQRQPLLDTPAVTTFSAQLAHPLGAPGANVTFIWQPTSSPIYDRYNMVGPTASTSIRIPWDGIYDIVGSILANTSAQLFEWAGTLQGAPTSDSGFGAPVFATLLNASGFAIRYYFANRVAPAVLPTRYVFGTRGLEFHANDLIQLLGQISAAGNNGFTVEQLDVRWCAPIPNNMINV
jgi:hypothetical protein